MKQDIVNWIILLAIYIMIVILIFAQEGKKLKISLKAFSLTLILVIYAIGVVTIGKDLADKWNDVVGLLFVIAGILNLSVLYWF